MFPNLILNKPKNEFLLLDLFFFSGEKKMRHRAVNLLRLYRQLQLKYFTVLFLTLDSIYSTGLLNKILFSYNSYKNPLREVLSFLVSHGKLSLNDHKF